MGCFLSQVQKLSLTFIYMCNLLSIPTTNQRAKHRGKNNLRVRVNYELAYGLLLCRVQDIVAGHSPDISPRTIPPDNFPPHQRYSPAVNPLTCTGNYSATSNNIKLVHSPPSHLFVVPNVTATHQRPVYQSPYCCIMVRCSAVLIAYYRVKANVRLVVSELCY